MILALSITTNAYGQLKLNFSRNISRGLASINIQKEIPQASLGTQKKNFNNFSSPTKALMAALPTYRDSQLSNYLKMIYRQSLSEKPILKLSSYEQMQRTFGLPLKNVSPKVSYVESDQKIKMVLFMLMV